MHDRRHVQLRGVEHGKVGDDRRSQQQWQLGAAEDDSVDVVAVAQTRDQRDELVARRVAEIALEQFVHVRA